jgi:uncharacterized lipoprotein YajG
MRKYVLPITAILLLAACAHQPDRDSKNNDSLAAKQAASSQPCSTLTPSERRQRQSDLGSSDCQETEAERASRQNQKTDQSSPLDRLAHRA